MHLRLQIVAALLVLQHLVLQPPDQRRLIMLRLFVRVQTASIVVRLVLQTQPQILVLFQQTRCRRGGRRRRLNTASATTAVVATRRQHAVGGGGGNAR